MIYTLAGYIILHINTTRPDVLVIDGPFPDGSFTWDSELPNQEEIASLAAEGALLWEALPAEQKAY